jgi:hypothetical protein
MVKRWPMLDRPMSLRSECSNATSASPVIASSMHSLVPNHVQHFFQHVPTKVSAYCGSPRLDTKSALWSADQSSIRPRGEGASLCEYVVGVCSVEGLSEPIEEASPKSRGGNVGDMNEARSYSSSASESS